MTTDNCSDIFQLFPELLEPTKPAAAWHNSRFEDDAGQTMFKVTVESHGQALTFPLGRNHGYRRKEGAVTLCAAASSVLPFGIEVDVNADGSWTLRAVETLLRSPSGHCQYWHFATDMEGKNPPTEAQRATLASWIYKPDARPYSCGGGPGAPVCRWAFEGMETSEIEALGNNGQPAFYA